MPLFAVLNDTAKTVQLNDTAGSDGLKIKDANGFTVAELDSKGNLKLRGKVQRI